LKFKKNQRTFKAAWRENANPALAGNEKHPAVRRPDFSSRTNSRGAK
jgi:hypothetical protein